VISVSDSLHSISFVLPLSYRPNVNGGVPLSQPNAILSKIIKLKDHLQWTFGCKISKGKLRQRWTDCAEDDERKAGQETAYNRKTTCFNQCTEQIAQTTFIGLWHRHQSTLVTPLNGELLSSDLS